MTLIRRSQIQKKSQTPKRSSDFFVSYLPLVMLIHYLFWLSIRLIIDRLVSGKLDVTDKG